MISLPTAHPNPPPQHLRFQHTDKAAERRKGAGEEGRQWGVLLVYVSTPPPSAYQTGGGEERGGGLRTNDSTTIPLRSHRITVDSVDNLLDGLERCAEDSEGGEFLWIPISRSVGRVGDGWREECDRQRSRKKGTSN